MTPNFNIICSRVTEQCLNIGFPIAVDDGKVEKLILAASRRGGDVVFQIILPCTKMYLSLTKIA